MKGIFATVRTLFCLLLLSRAAYAQDYEWHPRNALALSLNFSQVVEENISPVKFSAPGPGGALMRRHETADSYQTMELSGYAVFPRSAAEKTTRSRLVSIAFKYAYMLQGAFGNEHLSVGAFGKVSFKDAYYKNFDETLLYWANFYGAGAAAAFVQPLSDKYAFEAIFELPLIGAGFRPETVRSYKIQNTSIGGVIKSNNSNGNFVVPGNYFNPSLSAALLGSKRSLLRSVSYKYTRVREKVTVSNPFRESNHQLTLTFALPAGDSVPPGF